MGKNSDKKMLFEAMNKVTGMPLNKIQENNGNSQLPPELSYSEDANIIMAKINELLDLLNDPNIDQSEGGVSDKMREIALHMINTNR